MQCNFFKLFIIYLTSVEMYLFEFICQHVAMPVVFISGLFRWRCAGLAARLGRIWTRTVTKYIAQINDLTKAIFRKHKHRVQRDQRHSRLAEICIHKLSCLWNTSSGDPGNFVTLFVHVGRSYLSVILFVWFFLWNINALAQDCTYYMI